MRTAVSLNLNEHMDSGVGNLHPKNMAQRTQKHEPCLKTPLFLVILRCFCLHGTISAFLSLKCPRLCSTLHIKDPKSDRSKKNEVKRQSEDRTLSVKIPGETCITPQENVQMEKKSHRNFEMAFLSQTYF